MSKKSNHKKFKYSSSKKANTLQTPTAGQAVSKPLAASVKTAVSSGKQAGAQYLPDQFKYVGTELKMSGALAAVILIVIVVLSFIIH